MKKILSLLFSLLLMLSVLAVNVFAEDETQAVEARSFIVDLAGSISTDSENTLNQKAADVLEETGVAFYGILLNDPDVESLYDYAKDFDDKRPQERCVIIVENKASKYFRIYGTGGMLTDARETALENAYQNDDVTTYAEAFDLVLDTMSELFAPSEYEGLPGCGDPYPLPIPPGVGADHIPDHRLQPRLVDAAGIIPDDKEAEILELLDKQSEADKFEYCIATTPSCGSLSPMETADDYYDYNGFGYGENRDGVLLLISMDPRYVWISTTGKGMKIISGDDVDKVIDSFYDELKAGDYDTVCTTFVKSVKTELSSYKGRPYVLFLVVFGIAFLISKAIIAAQKKKHTTVKSQPSAAGYIIPGTFVLTRNQDKFRHRYVSKTAIPKNTGSGGSSGGGGGSHVSSSGTAHGGGGRSF